MIKAFCFLVACLAIVTTYAHGATITYNFSTTVVSVDNAAPNFPTSLNSVMVGDAITGSLVYDTASPVIPNTVVPGSLRPNATTYDLNGFSFSVNIGGVDFSNPWPGIANAAFVWDNDSPAGLGYDGLLYTNVGPLDPQFQIGRINMGSSTFTDESLPAGDIASSMTFTLGSGGNSQYWIQGGQFELQPVPVPAAVWLLGSGLVGVLGLSRKFGKN